MKKSIKYLIVIFIMLLCININKIHAAQVSSNGDFTIGGETYNINTSEAISGSSTKIKEIQMYSDKTVSEICKYTESNEASSRDVKYLFIYSDGSASVGWVGEGSNFLYGDNENDHDGYESIIFNWYGGDTKRKWDSANKQLTEDFDAYTAYKNSGTCPYYLVLNNDYWHNYIYLSTDTGYDNLENIEEIAATPQGEKKGTTHTFYSIGEYSKSRAGLSCNYTLGDEESFALNFDSSGAPSIKMSGTKNAYGSFQLGDYLISGYQISSNFSSVKYWSYVEEGKCPYKIQTCLTLDTDTGTYDMVFYGDESTTADGTCSSELEFYCVGDKCSSGECGVYSDFYNRLVEELENYKKCTSSSCQEELKNYNLQKETIATFCSSVLENLNYSKGGCVESCLNLSNTVAQLEIDAGLRTGYSKIKCNIGSSILSMVYNIFKWVKYIAPALVIILSILDFIKAIAASSEDDMKKAQGKFIKRLIVAALLFLLPLLINFMLKTFGLYNSECDISDLFS